MLLNSQLILASLASESGIMLLRELCNPSPAVPQSRMATLYARARFELTVMSYLHGLELVSKAELPEIPRWHSAPREMSPRRNATVQLHLKWNVKVLAEHEQIVDNAGHAVALAHVDEPFEVVRRDRVRDRWVARRGRLPASVRILHSLPVRGKRCEVIAGSQTTDVPVREDAMDC